MGSDIRYEVVGLYTSVVLETLRRQGNIKDAIDAGKLAVAGLLEVTKENANG